MDTEGNIIELEWVKGLDGAKGMGIVGDLLYVANIDELVEIEIESGTIKNRYSFESTPTLNDITIGDDGSVFISAYTSEKIFQWKDGETTVLQEGELETPNGLYVKDSELYMLKSGSGELQLLNLENMEVDTLAKGFGHSDGIVPVGDGDYLVSNWQGEVFYVSSDWKVTKLLDTKAQKISSADIEYIQERNLLLIPTFFDNRVVAYTLEY